jgi:hypothetical protein
MDKLHVESTTELKTAQAFLTNADDVWEAELASMVGNLINSFVPGAGKGARNRDPILEMRAEETGLNQFLKSWVT